MVNIKDDSVEDMLSDLGDIIEIYALIKGVRVTPEAVTLCLTYMIDRFYDPSNLEEMKAEVNRLSIIYHYSRYASKLKEKLKRDLTEEELNHIISILEPGPDTFRELFKKEFGIDFYDLSEEITRDNEMERKSTSDKFNLKDIIAKDVSRYIQ